MIVHELGGCAPTPLAHYLKALGVLRLVAEQADSEARGWWEGERYFLATNLDREPLEAFLLERYQPTPLVSPWNKGSGFFYKNDSGLNPIENSRAPRFAAFRAGIQAGRKQFAGLADADQAIRRVKAESTNRALSPEQRKALRESEHYKKRLAEAERSFKSLKADFIPRLRLAWRGPHQQWMDAAIVLGDKDTPLFPALLGTGGNDGRLDFTNNFMQRLGDIFDLTSVEGAAHTTSTEWIRGSLWGGATSGCQVGSSVGQYLPGSAGGANTIDGPSGDTLLNPVDFVLMMEGTVLFTAYATKRLSSTEMTRAAAPFAISGHAAGYASASNGEESARGEQWMPLWSQPITLPELKHLLGEGRAQLRAKAVREPIGLARAVARLGVARGVSAFQRFGYIERNGQSNLAVPLGRYRVPDQDFPLLSCLNDLDVWLPRLRREVRTDHAPPRLRLAERRVADALFTVARQPDEPGHWQSVLRALAGLETVMSNGSGFKVGPIPPLRPEWVSAAADSTPEFRLALCSALQASGFSRSDGVPIDGVRRHWLPLNSKKHGTFSTSGDGGQTRLLVSPEVVMHGRCGEDDLIALLERRLIESAQTGQRRVPLEAAYGADAAPADLAALTQGGVDLDRTMQLSRALMALNGAAWAMEPRPQPQPATNIWPDDAWLAIRLAMLPWPLTDRRISADPAVLRRLAAGDATTAVELALRRLRATGIAATVRVAAVPTDTARRWAAALAFPISRKTATQFLKRLDPNSTAGEMNGR
jgi:CRISPR-associated protein Csx17